MAHPRDESVPADSTSATAATAARLATESTDHSELVTSETTTGPDTNLAVPPPAASGEPQGPTTSSPSATNASDDTGTSRATTLRRRRAATNPDTSDRAGSPGPTDDQNWTLVDRLAPLAPDGSRETPGMSFPSPSAPSTTTDHPPPPAADKHAPESSGEFSCNICFDTASSPVLTRCGHLYCWPCLHQWLQSQARNPLCPVCKAGCEAEQVIPVYGRGKERVDPRLQDPTVPARPAAQRPEPRPRQPGPANPFSMFWDMGPGVYNVHMGATHPVAVSAGLDFGLFPSLFGMQFNFRAPQPPVTPGNPNSDEALAAAQIQAQQAFISRLFLALGMLILVSIILY
ncbi:hypothetical protein IWQ60_009216 [Tieghemiomyces parasiticus]|uniref:RING-type E3 ubiquitin transferase n=1 Tax=Tieghemiomyces parasiticus TaxID=78921 RepID=A0A9W8DK88_9FUNG|nr:hypothetical protein IWQ60_009216 [Tieghemiomyces parasiticus]